MIDLAGTLCGKVEEECTSTTTSIATGCLSLATSCLDQNIACYSTIHNAEPLRGGAAAYSEYTQQNNLMTVRTCELGPL